MLPAVARRIVPRTWRAVLKRLITRNPNPDEIELVRLALKRVHKGQMVDVGAHRGGASWPFLEQGWRSLAFEPNTANRNILIEKFGNLLGLTVDSRAISDRIASDQVFYTSAISSIGSLRGFHRSHVPGEQVCVTTLDHALAEYGLGAIDFLKIDIEGYDLFALRGLSESVPVRAIMAEFEDRKTRVLGYCAADLGDCLVSRGFRVVASVWHPIVEYGQRHRWRGFYRYPCAIDPDAWGNFIAFSSQKDLERFEFAARRWSRSDGETARL